MILQLWFTTLGGKSIISRVGYVSVHCCIIESGAVLCGNSARTNGDHTNHLTVGPTMSSSKAKRFHMMYQRAVNGCATSVGRRIKRAEGGQISSTTLVEDALVVSMKKNMTTRIRAVHAHLYDQALLCAWVK